MDSSKTTPPQEAKLHFLDYWRIIRIRKTVILAVFILIVITATLVTFILPERFVGTSRIKVERNISDIDPIGNRQYAPGTYDAYFIQTEFEVMQSEVILGRVVTNLNLNEEWGKKISDQPLKTHQSIDILKNKISLNTIRNTMLIEINAFGDRVDETSRIANPVAEAYSEHRLEQSHELVKHGIRALEERL